MPELDELDNDLNHIARVTPLGLSPVTDAQSMAALNQRVLDMMTDKVISVASDVADLAQERTNLKAEITRWEEAYTKVFAALENAWARIDGLQTWLDQRGETLQDEFVITRELQNRIEHLEAQQKTCHHHSKGALEES